MAPWSTRSEIANLRAERCTMRLSALTSSTLVSKSLLKTAARRSCRRPEWRHPSHVVSAMAMAASLQPSARAATKAVSNATSIAPIASGHDRRVGDGECTSSMTSASAKSALPSRLRREVRLRPLSRGVSSSARVVVGRVDGVVVRRRWRRLRVVERPRMTPKTADSNASMSASWAPCLRAMNRASVIETAPYLYVAWTVSPPLYAGDLMPRPASRTRVGTTPSVRSSSGPW